MSKIRQHTTDHRALTKHNPLAKLTMSAIHDRQREEAKTASLDHRFQFVSKLRHLDEANQEVAEDSLLNHAGDKVQIYDVILGGTPQADSGKAVITCNNAVMIREQVAPRSNPSGELAFVVCDWSSLTVYEPEYVHDVIESEDGEEDDDDSNGMYMTVIREVRGVTVFRAEDNWRNDYPDEDEWKEDEGEGPQSSASDDDVSTNQAYRGRAVPLMLDYAMMQHGNVAPKGLRGVENGDNIEKDELRNNGDDSYENGDPVM
eukprot:Em0015g918a